MFFFLFFIDARATIFFVFLCLCVYFLFIIIIVVAIIVNPLYDQYPFSFNKRYHRSTTRKLGTSRAGHARLWPTVEGAKVWSR